MRPIDFDGANAIYNKPESMKDGECGSLSAYQHLDDDGNVVSIVTM